MNLKTDNKGFTLIELLVIIAIITFLASSIFLYLAQSRQKSRDAKRVADAKQISSALDLFNSHCGTYPIAAATISIDSTRALWTGTGVNCGTRTGSSSVNGGLGLVATTPGGIILVRQFPSAPLPADGAICQTGSNSAYRYTAASPGTTYTLTFCIGAATAGYPAGINTITR